MTREQWYSYRHEARLRRRQWREVEAAARCWAESMIPVVHRAYRALEPLMIYVQRQALIETLEKVLLGRREPMSGTPEDATSRQAVLAESGEPYEAGTIWGAPDGSEWSLSFHVKRIAGRPECVGLDIRPHPYPFARLRERPLRAAHLRFPFAALLARALGDEGVTRRSDEMLEDLARRMGGRVPELEPARLETTRGKPRQRPRYTTNDYQCVATVYRELWKAGSRSPGRDTAEALGLRPDQAAKLIQQCRLKGYLPKTNPGVGAA